MFIRFLLFVIGALVAVNALLFGERTIAPELGISWMSEGGSRWLLPKGMNADGKILLISMGFLLIWSAFETVRQLTRYTLLPIVGYVSRMRICYLAVLLIVSALTYGAVTQPVAGNGEDITEWLATYPRSIAVWIILLPMLGIFVNLLREVALACKEYEARIHAPQQPQEEEVEEADPALEAIEDLKTAVLSSHTTILRGMQEHSSALGRKLDGVDQSVTAQMDGVFSNLRKITGRLPMPASQTGPETAPSGSTNASGGDNVTPLPTRSS